MRTLQPDTLPAVAGTAHAVSAFASGVRSTRSTRSRTWQRRIAITSAVLASAVGIVVVARSGWYDAASPPGYWLGVFGATAMLLLMAYPLSKRSASLQRWIAIRHWFAFHMALGVLGPVAILLHCTLRIGSPNAAVAFWSMVVVASSGVFGRFLYRRLHAGLDGRQRTHADVVAAAEARLHALRHGLDSAPQLRATLRRFAAQAEAVGRAGWRSPVALATLGFAVRRCLDDCRRHLEFRPRAIALPAGIDAALQDYLHAVRDAAQFRAFAQVFALWHTLHIPLVVLLAVSALVHVVAVHLY